MVIIKNYGAVGKYQVNAVKWEAADKENKELGCVPNEGETTFDIRRWEGDAPKEGVTLTKKEATALVFQMVFSDKNEKPDTTAPLKKGKDFEIYQVLCHLGAAKCSEKLFTYSKVEGNNGYDIRNWKEDGKFSKGISLKRSEYLALHNLLFQTTQAPELEQFDWGNKDYKNTLTTLLYQLGLSYYTDKLDKIIEELPKFLVEIERKEDL